MVIIDDNASLKLFTASKTTAIEFVINPMIALNNAKNILAIIPMILVFIIIFLS